jgi:hypothetical protein
MHGENNIKYIKHNVPKISLQELSCTFEVENFVILTSFLTRRGSFT